mgnify:FL=1
MAWRKKCRRTGRKRKDAMPRQPDGSIKNPPPREREQDILAVGLGNPDRRGQPDPRSPRHATLLGKLRLSGQIDAIQFGAGERYASLRTRYLSAIAANRETAPAMDTTQEPTARPLWSGVVADEDQAQAEADTRRAWADCLSALRDASRVYHGWSRPNVLAEIIRAAVVDNRMGNLGDLMIALNVLSSLWRMREPRVE